MRYQTQKNDRQTYHHANEPNYVTICFQVILSSLCGYNAAVQLNFVKSPHSFIYRVNIKKYPPTTFVDISAMRGDFCMLKINSFVKFHAKISTHC